MLVKQMQDKRQYVIAGSEVMCTILEGGNRQLILMWLLFGQAVIC
jgi:hypothetical protein